MTRAKQVNTDARRRMVFGQERRILLPASEVCVHMGVAGHVWPVRLVDDRQAQLLYDDGRPFSFPITPGEAGIFRAHDGTFYTY